MDGNDHNLEAFSPSDRGGWGFGEVLRLSLPASLTMLNATLMRFVDGWMVSRISPEQFSAQLLGGMTAFVFESFILGILAVVTTFVSQNFGSGRFARCSQYTWAGLVVALVLAGVAAPMIPAATPLFGLFHRVFDTPTEVVHHAAIYFRYMIMGIALSQCSVVFQRFFYGVHRPGVVFVVSLVANAFNVLANYTLIFGKFGFPRLELAGAAIGTLASMLLMLCILAAMYLSPGMHAKFGTRRIRLRLADVRDILRIGWPAGVQFCNDLLSWSVFTMALVGRFGTDHLAANAATLRYMSLSFMPAVGINIATTSLVGRYVGEGRCDVARRRAHAAFLLAMAYMGTCAVVFLIFRHPLIGFFATVTPSADLTAAEAQQRTADIIRYGGRILVCAAVFQLFDAMSIVFIGALRGAGDTLWPMLVSIALSWTLILGGGLLAVKYLPKLTSLGPWLAVSAYIIVLGLLLAWRFERGAWQKIDLLGRSGE